MVPELPGELWTRTRRDHTVRVRRVRRPFLSNKHPPSKVRRRSRRTAASDRWPISSHPRTSLSAVCVWPTDLQRARALLQEAFKLSQVITRRAAVSHRCGTSKLSMDLLYASVLRHVEELIGTCQAPVEWTLWTFWCTVSAHSAGYMRVYKKNRCSRRSGPRVYRHFRAFART